MTDTTLSDDVPTKRNVDEQYTDSTLNSNEQKKFIVSRKVLNLRDARTTDLVRILGSTIEKGDICDFPETLQMQSLQGSLLLSQNEISEYLEFNCPYCMAILEKDDQVVLCKNCKVAHHFECWNLYSGCTTLGCVYNRYLAS